MVSLYSLNIEDENTNISNNFVMKVHSELKQALTYIYLLTVLLSSEDTPKCKNSEAIIPT